MSKSVATPAITVEPKLLQHPWYRKWECGEVSVDGLRHYAQEYYWQVSNFPRYLSLLHSQIENLEQRQVLLRNLADEENPKMPHPELWLDFAESLGMNRQAIKSSSPGPASRALVEEFRAIVGSSAAEGLGAILAYESQVPEIAQFKSKALKQFYLKGERAEAGARFFDVHREADVWHTAEVEELVDSLPEDMKIRAQAAASRACAALWKFLDAMPN